MENLTILDLDTGKGRMGPAWTVGVQAVEVEYNTKEHTYKLLKAATVLDAGRVINPQAAKEWSWGYVYGVEPGEP